MLVTAVLLSLATVACVTAVVLRYAPQIGLVDRPVARSAHGSPVPLGGGAALALPYFLVLAYVASSGLLKAVWPAYLACLAVLVLGLVDDRRPLSLRLRLPLQFAAAITAVAVFQPAQLDLGPWRVEHEVVLGILAVFALVWMVNLVNFMDGIDGLAASQLLTVAASGALLIALSGTLVGADETSPGSGLSLVLCAVLAGSALGFLPWNWSPAKIFMGDCGSGFIGFALGLLALDTLTSGALSLWVWLILMAVFVVDTALTLVTRLAHRAPWYEGHATHAYQILARRLGGHARVTRRVLAINTLYLLPLAALACAFPRYGVLFTLIAYLPLVWIARSLGAGRPANSEPQT